MTPAVRPLTYLTRTTVILLIGLCLVAAWRVWADWFVVRAAGYGVDPLTRAVNLRDAAGWAYTATLAVAATVFFCWVWRARANAEVLSRAEHRLPRGWVIGGWLAPMLNAFMPKVLMEDIWRTSRPDVRPELLDARDSAGQQGGHRVVADVGRHAVLRRVGTGGGHPAGHRVRVATDRPTRTWSSRRRTA